MENINRNLYYHNDLKPSNISVSIVSHGRKKETDVNVVLLDFALMSEFNKPIVEVFKQNVLSSPKESEYEALEKKRRKYYAHYAPELWHEAKSSNWSEIYSVCVMVKKTFQEMKRPPHGMDELLAMGLSRDPNMRPKLQRIVSMLDSVYMEQYL